MINHYVIHPHFKTCYYVIRATNWYNLRQMYVLFFSETVLDKHFGIPLEGKWLSIWRWDSGLFSNNEHFGVHWMFIVPTGILEWWPMFQAKYQMRYADILNATIASQLKNIEGCFVRSHKALSAFFTKTLVWKYFLQHWALWRVWTGPSVGAMEDWKLLFLRMQHNPQTLLQTALTWPQLHTSSFLSNTKHTESV